MSEEIKSLKEYISTTKNEIFTTFKIETISNLIIYYEDLQQRVEQLENIRKEAITYILANCEIIRHEKENVDEVGRVNGAYLLNILNKGE